MMGRFIFDVFVKKEPYILFPLALCCRSRAGKRIKPEVDEKYISSLEANSYDEAVRKFTELLAVNQERSKE